MANPRSVAIGFICPQCLWQYAYITRTALPQLELECMKCRYPFAVEP